MFSVIPHSFRDSAARRGLPVAARLLSCNTRKSAWAGVIVLLVFSAWSDRLAAQSLQPVLPSAIASQYALFWNDEFDGTQLDSSKWAYRQLGPRGGAIDSASMVALDGAGHLNLTVQESGGTIYAAMIGTQGKFQTTYGYFECRAQLQKLNGPTSSFWLQSPTTGNPLGNPAVAGDEIDIFECYTPAMGKIPQTIHWDGYGANEQSLSQMSVPIPNLTQGFHTFGLEWTPTEYIFYIDGAETFRTAQAVSQTNEYIILSDLVGTAQATIINKTPGFTDSIVFDYVRVYKLSPPVVSTPLAPINATAGQSVSWTAAATGAAPLTYQWRKNGAPLAGATGSMLTLANVQAADAGDYDVVITNSVGSATSSSATLTVSAPLLAPYNAVVSITVS